MKDRIQLLLKEKNLTAGKFAEILDVQPSSISHLLSGRNNPNFDFLVKLLERFPDVNPDWFITGQGNILRNAMPDVPVIEKSVSLPPPAPQRQEAEAALLSLSAPAPTGKKVEKIVFFYTDRSFSAYTEEE